MIKKHVRSLQAIIKYRDIGYEGPGSRLLKDGMNLLVNDSGYN